MPRCSARRALSEPAILGYRGILELCRPAQSGFIDRVHMSRDSAAGACRANGVVLKCGTACHATERKMIGSRKSIPTGRCRVGRTFISGGSIVPVVLVVLLHLRAVVG